MKGSRVLISSGYWLALLLILLPLMQALAALLPTPSFGIRWRLEAFGAMGSALLLPMAGGAVAVGTAALLSHRRVMRALALTALVVSAVMAAAITIFVLDLVQYRAVIGAELRQAFVLTGLSYLVTFLLEMAFLMWLGNAAWRATVMSRRGHLRRVALARREEREADADR